MKKEFLAAEDRSIFTTTENKKWWNKTIIRYPKSFARQRRSTETPPMVSKVSMVNGKGSNM